MPTNYLTGYTDQGGGTLTEYTVSEGSSPPAIRVATTSPVTITNTDTYVLVKLDTPGPVTVNLPAIAVHEPKVVVVKDRTGDALENNITINANGGETIDGTASKTLVTNYGSVTLVGAGTEWSIV